jgi:NADH-quinone oxidoreductase subunit I
MTTRGYIALIEDKCTSCMLCVRECPTWCITLDARTELDPEAELVGGGRKARTHHVLETFEIDYGLCMYCGICVEVCPFDALEWRESQTPLATGERDDLVHGIPELTNPPQ